VGEALGRALGAQMESAEERCNDSSPLSAARKKRRIGDEGQSASFSKFFKCFSLPFLTSYLDSTTNQAGYFPPPSAPSRPLPRSPSRSHGVERAKPSLRGRLSHAADEAQGRFNLN